MCFAFYLIVHAQEEGNFICFYHCDSAPVVGDGGLP